MNPLATRLPTLDQLPRYWAQLRTAFERETEKNPRIHLGLLAILAILLLGLWFEIQDSHSHADIQIAADAQQLAMLHRLAGQTEWKGRSDSVQRLRVQLESRLWEAESDGLAQVNFQELLGKLAKSAELPRTDVHVEIVSSTATTQTYRQMSATVTGPFAATAMQKFLASLESDGHMMVVDRLRIEATPTPRFEMLVSTYLNPTKAKPAGPVPR
ncbi:MAG: GspMb/PilO family protein [Aliidongia sp.]